MWVGICHVICSQSQCHWQKQDKRDVSEVTLAMIVGVAVVVNNEGIMQ